MANNDELTNALLAIGAVGLGLAGAAAISAHQQRRRSFRSGLDQWAADNVLEIVSAELGRSGGQPTWFVTIKLPNGAIASYNATLTQDQSGYADRTLMDLINRLGSAIHRDYGWGHIA